MAAKPEEIFSKFLEFCKPHLEKQRSTELVKLIEKRFHDCSDEFKASSEFSDLTEITSAKIESDSGNIFIHLRDYIHELKSKGDRKRKRETNHLNDCDLPSPKSLKGESTGADTDDDSIINHETKRSHLKIDPENVTSKNVKVSSVFTSTEVKEVCITIDDSDDECAPTVSIATEEVNKLKVNSKVRPPSKKFNLSLKPKTVSTLTDENDFVPNKITKVPRIFPEKEMIVLDEDEDENEETVLSNCINISSTEKLPNSGVRKTNENDVVLLHNTEEENKSEINIKNTSSVNVDDSNKGTKHTQVSVKEPENPRESENQNQKTYHTEVQKNVHDSVPSGSLTHNQCSSEKSTTDEKPSQSSAKMIESNIKKASGTKKTIQHTCQPGTSSENQNEMNTGKEEETTEKQKEGKKKSQIRRLERLLENIRNKIEELKERELTLDDMDDDCSAYILEEKYQQKFVKVWKKLCELKKEPSATGRPSERRFKFTGTRYPEINRKIEKFVNRRKEFPDFYDIRNVIMKVNNDKKIGLGSMAVERLAKEAFLDVGETLQKRRKLDLAYTSAGHMKIGESPTEDPASKDPELKKKLMLNKKFYKEKMDQVLTKYSEIEIEDGGDEDEGNESGDVDDDNELEDDGLKDEVPELTTILDDRLSPVLENLEKKGHSSKGHEQEIFWNKEFKSGNKDRDAEFKSRRVFKIKNSCTIDNAEEIEEGEKEVETDCSMMEEKTSGDENPMGSPISLLDLNDVKSAMNDSIDNSEVSTGTSCTLLTEEKTSGDEEPLGSPAVLWEIDEDDVNRSTINNTTVIYLDRENETHPQQKETNKIEEEECPILYTAVRIDDVDDKNKPDKAETQCHAESKGRKLTGDDDLFEMSGVEEMSDSDDDGSRLQIADIINTLDSPNQNEVSISGGVVESKSEEKQCSNFSNSFSVKTKFSSLDTSEKQANKSTVIDKLCSKVSSDSVKAKVRNLLHSHVNVQVKSSCDERLDEELEIFLDAEEGTCHSNKSAHMEPRDHGANKSSKIFLLTSDLKTRARNVLSLNLKKNLSQKNNFSPETERTMDNKTAILCDSTTHSSDEQVIVDSQASSVKYPLDSRSRSSSSDSQTDKKKEDSEKKNSKIHEKSVNIELDSVGFTESSESLSDPNDIIELSLHGSLDSNVDSIDEAVSNSEKVSQSLSQNDSQGSSPFLKIVGVTSIGLEEYNSDSCDTAIDKLTTETSLEASKSENNRISKLFGKGDRISNFLSSRTRSNDSECNTCILDDKNLSGNKNIDNSVSGVLDPCRKLTKEIDCTVQEKGNIWSSSSIKNAKTSKDIHSIRKQFLQKEKWNKEHVQKSLIKAKMNLLVKNSKVEDTEIAEVDDDIVIIQEDIVTCSAIDDDVVVLSDSE